MRPSLVLSCALACVALACAPAADEPFGEHHAAIVGGVVAEPGAWPGVAAVYMSAPEPLCGGTLVADSWVLTAAHCLSPPSPTGGVTKIVLGRYDLTTEEGETRFVDRAILHEGHDEFYNDDDIALLHLTEPSTLPKTPLPTRAQLARVTAGAEATAVGWGLTSERGDGSDLLLQVSVPLVANDVCKTYPGYGRVTDDMLCAGVEAGGLDACQKDSGGPLFSTLDGALVQIGVVSWGIGCARERSPGVYARVGSYLGWLFEKTEGAVGEAP